MGSMCPSPSPLLSSGYFISLQISGSCFFFRLQSSIYYTNTITSTENGIEKEVVII